MKIKCFRCGKKGNVRKYYHTYRLRVKILEQVGKKVCEKTEVKEFVGDIWKAKGFKNIGLMGVSIPLDRYVWVCDKCLKRKCKLCSIGLSNKWICKCGLKHGAFYPNHPDYCKQCWDAKRK